MNTPSSTPPPCARTCSACRRASSPRSSRKAATRSCVDAWQREPGGTLEGDGISRLVEGGTLLERGGCGFSHVKGRSLPASATQHRAAELADAPFEAMGVSLVFHPRNPYVPTVHMNVRMLAALPPAARPVVWFGGGMDLTPYYGFEDDARPLPSRLPRRARAVRRRQVPALQALVRRLLLPQAPARAARHRRHLLRRLLRRRLRQRLRPDARGRRRLRRRLPADRAAPPRPALRRARARLPDLPARPLRRVQPRLRPRHAVRPAIGRAHREHPDVDAAGRHLALRLAAGAGLARGAALQRFPAAARLGRRGVGAGRDASA